MMRLALSALLVVSGLASTFAVASTVTSGTIVGTGSIAADYPIDLSNLTSPDGGWILSGGLEGIVDSTCSSGSCRVLLTEDANANPFFGTITQNGTSYPVLLSADPILCGGASILPSLATSPFAYTGPGTYSVPFTSTINFDAVQVVYSGSTCSVVQTFVGSATGAGIATFTLGSDQQVNGQATFAFSTPEPAAIWFAGLGSLVLGIWQRKRIRYH